MNGVSIYNAVDADEEDAYETEGSTFDACGASTDGSGRSVFDPRSGIVAVTGSLHKIL